VVRGEHEEDTAARAVFERFQQPLFDLLVPGGKQQPKSPPRRNARFVLSPDHEEAHGAGRLAGEVNSWSARRISSFYTIHLDRDSERS